MQPDPLGRKASSSRTDCCLLCQRIPGSCASPGAHCRKGHILPKSKLCPLPGRCSQTGFQLRNPLQYTAPAVSGRAAPKSVGTAQTGSSTGCSHLGKLGRLVKSWRGMTQGRAPVLRGIRASAIRSWAYACNLHMVGLEIWQHAQAPGSAFKKLGPVLTEYAESCPWTEPVIQRWRWHPSETTWMKRHFQLQHVKKIGKKYNTSEANSEESVARCPNWTTR